jgi:hypothetical protein
MDGRKRWVIISRGLVRDTAIYNEEFNRTGIAYWTGKDTFTFEMWTPTRDGAVSYKTREQAESDLLLLVAKRPEWIGQLGVGSFVEYDPRIEEV